jgi:hypothetical protein
LGIGDGEWDIVEVERGIADVEWGIIDVERGTGEVDQARFDLQRAGKTASTAGRERSCGTYLLSVLNSPLARSAHFLGEARLVESRGNWRGKR